MTWMRIKKELVGQTTYIGIVHGKTRKDIEKTAWKIGRFLYGDEFGLMQPFLFSMLDIDERALEEFEKNEFSPVVKSAEYSGSFPKLLISLREQLTSLYFYDVEKDKVTEFKSDEPIARKCEKYEDGLEVRLFEFEYEVEDD